MSRAIKQEKSHQSKLPKAGSYFQAISSAFDESEKEENGTNVPMSPKFCFRASENGYLLFSNNPEEIRYTYEIVTTGIDTKDAITYLELAMTDYLIEYFCQSNETKNVLAIYSFPSDIINEEKECEINHETFLQSNKTCSVVEGGMTIAICSNCEESYENEEKVLRDIYLNSIVEGLDYNEFLLSPDIESVTYIEQKDILLSPPSSENLKTGYSAILNIPKEKEEMAQTIDEMTPVIIQDSSLPPDSSLSSDSPLFSTSINKTQIVMIVTISCITLIAILLSISTIKFLKSERDERMEKKRSNENSKALPKPKKIKLPRNNSQDIKPAQSFGKAQLLLRGTNSFICTGWNMKSIIHETSVEMKKKNNDFAVL